MWFIKALRNAIKYGKLGSGFGVVIGSIVGTCDDKSHGAANSAATGLAVGSVVGATFGFGSSLVDDHYRKVYG